jgi:hypothetical protein
LGFVRILLAHCQFDAVPAVNVKTVRINIIYFWANSIKLIMQHW